MEVDLEKRRALLAEISAKLKTADEKNARLNNMVADLGKETEHLAEISAKLKTADEKYRRLSKLLSDEMGFQIANLSSGWRGGGSDQMNECNSLVRRQYPNREFTILQTFEDFRWADPLRTKREYFYECTVLIKPA